MASTNSSQEMDFEDLLAKFERKFSLCDRGRDLYNNPDPSDVPREKPAHVLNVSSLAPELQDLWTELLTHIQINRGNTLPTSHQHHQHHHHHLYDGVTREVIRAEVRTTLSQIRHFQNSEPEDSQTLSSSQRATINSLKRRLTERQTQVNDLQRKLKQAELTKYRLREELQTHHLAISDFKATQTKLETQIQGLKIHNASLTKERDDANADLHNMLKERHRFQELLTTFRAEIVTAHHEAATARLEAKQAKLRTNELQKRAKESKESSQAVSSRIKELQEIQDEMIATMQNAESASDASAARRAMASLAEQRSRVIGRIANLLTKNKRTDTSDSPPVAPEQNDTSNSNPDSPFMPFSANSSSSPTPYSLSSGDGTTGLSENEVSPKRQLFSGIRRFGTDRARPNKPSRKTIIANAERTREAVEKDTEVLREVIEMKEKELERMDEELYDAKDQAASLERALQRERQHRRAKNRNMRSPALEKAKMEQTMYTTTHRKNQTLFEWQNTTTRMETQDEETCEISRNSEST